MMQRECLLLLSMLFVTTSSVPDVTYQHARLEDFCYKNGLKREVPVFNQPQMYVFNSSLATVFQCHLELELRINGPGVGFSAYIQSMNFLEGKDCSQGDYLQFGKDFLFITTDRSHKFCKKLKPPVPKYDEAGLPAGFEVDDQQATRVWRQDGGEMDVWIQIQPGQDKEIVLIITPTLNCAKTNTKFRACPNSSECVNSALFCDGKINCVTNSLDEDSRFCPHLEPGGALESSLIGIPLIIIICVGSIIFVTFMYFMIKEGVGRLRTARSPRGGSTEGGAGGQTLLGPGGGLIGLEERLREAPPQYEGGELPPHPPSYSEVVGDMSEDPPKYSEIEKIHSVV